MALERPRAKVTFRYKFSNRYSGDMKWRVRVFMDGFHIGCLWCTEITEDRSRTSASFVGPDGSLTAVFYFIDYEFVEDDV